MTLDGVCVVRFRQLDAAPNGTKSAVGLEANGGGRRSWLRAWDLRLALLAATRASKLIGLSVREAVSVNAVTPVLGRGVWHAAARGVVDVVLHNLLCQTASGPRSSRAAALGARALLYADLPNRECTIPELVDMVSRAVEHGFRAIKIHAASSDRRDFLRRIQAAQSVCGGGEILADGFREFRPREALQVAEGLISLGVHWFEEPVELAHLDTLLQEPGLHAMHIVAGEHVRGSDELETFLTTFPGSVVTPDVLMVGGMTGMQRAIDQAGRFNKELCFHGAQYPEIVASLSHPSWRPRYIAALPHFDTRSTCFEFGYRLKDGRLDDSQAVLDPSASGWKRITIRSSDDRTRR